MGSPAVTSTGATNNSKAEYHSKYNWAGVDLCTAVSVYKYYKIDDGDSDNADGPDRSGEVPSLKNKPCPEDSTCTIIKSRGYSDTCANINFPGTIVREVVSIY